jgi:hypothetical protein
MATRTWGIDLTRLSSCGSIGGRVGIASMVSLCREGSNGNRGEEIAAGGTNEGTSVLGALANTDISALAKEISVDFCGCRSILYGSWSPIKIYVGKVHEVGKLCRGSLKKTKK